MTKLDPARDPPRYIKLNERDNVAIVVNDFGLAAGSVFPDGLTLKAFVPQGHKTALVEIAEGGAIRRYGEIIGHAKAAIQAGVQLLLEHQNLRAADVQHLFLAGGFGTHMNAKNAIAIGMLPGFTPEQIVPVGNTALAGAYLALTDKTLLDDMRDAARRVEALELNLIPAFQDVYIDALSLP